MPRPAPAPPTRPVRAVRPVRAAGAAVACGLLAGSLLAAPGAGAAVREADAAAPEVTVTLADRRFDVLVDGGRRTAVPEARRATTDIVRTEVRVDRVARTLAVTWSLRDLRRVRGTQVLALLLQPEGAALDQGTVVVTDLSERLVASFELDGSADRRCRKATVGSRPVRDRAVVTVPFACFGGDREATVQAATATFPRRGGAFASDEARATRVLPLDRYVAPPTDGDPTDPATDPRASARTGTGAAARGADEADLRLLERRARTLLRR